MECVRNINPMIILGEINQKNMEYDLIVKNVGEKKIMEINIRCNDRSSAD